MKFSKSLTDIKVVLIDIEGTTTPITFVTEVLFPYIGENIESYLVNKWSDGEVQADVAALRLLAKRDIENKVPGVPEIVSNGQEGVKKSVARNVRWQMSSDRKSTALKELQGHMWRSAYEDGTIKGEVYDDVPTILKSLKNDHNKKLYIYSSGSVEAQKLLFKHSNQGDMRYLFSGNFDTKVGSKRESSSYDKISELINQQPKEILFLTDVVAEAEAAENAGIKVCMLLRPGNKPLSEEDLKRFNTVHSFEELVTSDEVARKHQKFEPTSED